MCVRSPHPPIAGAMSPSFSQWEKAKWRSEAWHTILLSIPTTGPYRGRSGGFSATGCSNIYVCERSVCLQSSCKNGFGDCNANETDGCEVDTKKTVAIQAVLPFVLFVSFVVKMPAFNL